MRDDVKKLIAEIEGNDSSVSGNAMVNLMYRVENSTKIFFKNGALGDENLSQDEQIEIISVLIEMAQSLKLEYSGLLLIVSKAIPIIMIDPVQIFVLKHAHEMPRPMLRQCLVALENCMRAPKGSRAYEMMRTKFKYEQLKTKLSDIDVQDIRVEYDLSDMLPDTLLFMEEFCTHTK